MRTLFWVGVVVGLALWVAALQQRLRAAQQRGDMYRDAAVRLDRMVAGSGGQEH
jgi:hypothetical protein